MRMRHPHNIRSHRHVVLALLANCAHSFGALILLDENQDEHELELGEVVDNPLRILRNHFQGAYETAAHFVSETDMHP